MNITARKTGQLAVPNSVPGESELTPEDVAVPRDHARASPWNPRGDERISLY